MKTLIWKDICTPVFIAALFTAKMWKQSRCSSIDECIKRMWEIYIYTYKYICIHIYTHKHIMEYWKEWNFAIVTTWMDLEATMPSEINQIKTNTIMISYVRSRKQNKWTNKAKQTRKNRTNWWLPEGRGVVEVWVGKVKGNKKYK